MRFLLLAIIIAVIGLSAAIIYDASSEVEYPIRLEGYTKLTPGMTEQEVADLLGVAPGNYTTGPVRPHAARGYDHVGSPNAALRSKQLYWLDDHIQIAADFDVQGKLVHAFLYRHHKAGVLGVLTYLVRNHVTGE